MASQASPAEAAAAANEQLTPPRDSPRAPGTPPPQTPLQAPALSPSPEQGPLPSGASLTHQADVENAVPTVPVPALSAAQTDGHNYHRVVYNLNQHYPNAQYDGRKLVRLLKDITQLMHITALKRSDASPLPKHPPRMFSDVEPKGSVFRLALRCYYIRGIKGVDKPIEFSSPEQQAENLSILKAVRSELTRRQYYFYLGPRDQVYLLWLKEHIDRVTGPLEVERKPRGGRTSHSSGGGAR